MLVRGYCEQNGFSSAAATAFIAALREEAMGRGPAAAEGAGSKVLEDLVDEMLRDTPR